MAFLKTRPEVDPAKLGLLGHSEGGIIAPMVAVRSQDVAFLVLLAGTGVDGEELFLLRQNHLMVKAAGGSEDLLKFLGELLPKQIAAIKAEKDPKIASEKLRAIAKEELARLPEAERAHGAQRRRLVAQQPGGSVEPSLDRYFLTYDPRPMLRKVKCPVLAINGEKDLQVPPKENLAAIASALNDGGNTHATVKELPGLNHLFQTCTTGALSEYKAQFKEGDDLSDGAGADRRLDLRAGGSELKTFPNASPLLCPPPGLKYPREIERLAGGGHPARIRGIACLLGCHRRPCLFDSGEGPMSVTTMVSVTISPEARHFSTG